jgi:heat shock protein HslJ
MNKPTGFILLVALALVLSGCGTPAVSSSDSDTITGIAWQWASVTDRSSENETTTTVPDPASYTITFNTDGTLQGKADCNDFDGTYSQGNGFSIEVTSITRAFCGDASFDQQYIQLLGEVSAGGPDGQGGLALETPGGAQRMMFQNGGAAE